MEQITGIDGAAVPRSSSNNADEAAGIRVQTRVGNLQTLVDVDRREMHLGGERDLDS